MIKETDITIWGRAFSLPIEYDCYEGESVTRSQKKRLKEFLGHPERIDSAKSLVEDYCKGKVLEDDENEKKDNIFSYVKPDYIFVKRDDANPIVVLMCKYKYDLEHGLAVAISDDGSASVGLQDMVL